MLDSGPQLVPTNSEHTVPGGRDDAEWPLVGAAESLAGPWDTAMSQLRRRWHSAPGAVASRPLSLHGWRVLVVVAAAALLAVAGTCASVWSATARDATAAADHALAVVESRLSDIELEMRQVADAAYDDMDWVACRPALATTLTRASIASLHVRRFVLSSDGMDGSCRPEGRGASPFFPYEPTMRIAITSTGEIQTQLTATLRRDTSGRVVSAVLDPRVFAMDGARHTPYRDDAQIGLSLLSADGRRLAPLGGSETGRATIDALGTTATSSLRHVMVRADVDRSELLRRLVRSGLIACGAAIALTLVLIAGFWRRVIHRARLVHRIQRGLRKREFEPFVQPIIDLRSGRCAGVEVLMRWQHPHRGTLPPSEFIEEAERTGLITGMSELVMTRAAHRLAPIAHSNPDIHFAFNLTPQQLAQPQLLTRLSSIFRPDTIPSDRVLLEITEREFVDPVAADSLNALHESGWRVAVDDFGTGHSSLAKLEQLSIDRLKIDRAFVSTISDETINRPVLDAIIQLADRLALPTIAEGIETQAQLDYLASRGVQFGQGYLIGRPMSIVAFGDWLKRHNSGTPPALPAQPHTAAVANARPDRIAQRMWNAMRVPGGLDIRDRMFHLRMYPHCFVGREAVDWMVQHARISRADAVQQGRRLLALGLMTHVLDEHDFEDAELFYRLASPSDASLASTPAPVALRARLQAQDGMRTRAHARGLVRHSGCLTGAEIVRWIVSSHRVSRPMARQWALQLMREGVIRHVYDDRPFADDRTLYRVV